MYTNYLLGFREFIRTQWNYDVAPTGTLQKFECYFLFSLNEVVKLWYVITLDAGK
jgi:hypothetical protein